MSILLYFGLYNLFYTSDFIYVIALLGVAVLGVIAQARVKSVFNKYSEVYTGNTLTAADVARELIRQGNSYVGVNPTAGSLTDNYNPKTGTVSLSESVYSSNSIAAMAVAAHEVGHVMQYESDYTPIKIRNSILPIASFGSNFSYILVFVGIIMGSFGYYISLVGAALFAFTFLFQLITLPVEFNASRRALDMLSAGGFITGAEQERGARKVLRAAAWTYVVAALASFTTLLRLLSIAGASRRRG